ncbi:3-(aryl)acryloyl-CoA:(R)-3-(aryl)lactate CoA-transferase FldA [Clostridium sporogenes]|jgi:cinnamoyl-CoA:phenyllactate CoA-transferase|uniref:CoA transferase n=2 Tax=Clostridium TaxID=1485 RepID=A0A7U4JRU7_CLOSG|nr:MULTISPECIES: 3-(aryl)acryloyl-CoA:(R)-3-(aryl)lactate CoA-transferase FldA [Clostridium]AJD30649.1 coA-transferase III family protein [Clostridium botulinum Prevot_594]AVP61306.1 CoA transferase [Clostridium botulinum]AKC64103.1 E-cinnamoyl-CoA:R-phenyllactate CoA transferase FldA [Clostridium sporogenes]AKJ91241.1 cinnamoyl-CoA:phenyllactate CoA-transferase [Clostridium sporogenes]AVP64905.1 CoA transferase [Clostridium botulinum]
MENNTNMFSGVKVIELANFIAAPAAGRFFADGGAEVIKIESPAGDPLRYTAPSEGRPLSQEENTTYDLENANKKAIVLNLKSEKGKKILHEMLAEADILLTNWRTKALVKQGLDYETLKEKYPKLVFAQITGYGEKGPDKDLPGFDYTAFFARGGVSGTLYEKGTVPPNVVPGLGDHQAGMFLAAGMAGALYKAKTTGQGDKVTVSLMHSAMYGLGIMIQAAQYKDHGLVYPINRNETPNPFIVSYKSKDDYFVQVCMPPYDVFYDRFMTALGREDLVGDERYNKIENLKDGRAKEVYSIIEQQMVTKTKDEWDKIFRDADIPFAIAQTWEDLLEDEQAWANDYLYKMKYPTGNERALVRLPVFFKEAGLPEYNQSPQIAENTVEVLKEMGYTEQEIEELEKDKDIMVRKEK